jgi:hypothetical protein
MQESSSTKHGGYLALPGEIRNMIYRLVLTSETPLHIVTPSVVSRPMLCAAHIDQIDVPKDFNQLKFVCRQLYTETADLELKFNKKLEIKKNSAEEEEVEVQLLSYTRLIGKSKMLSLKVITVTLKDSTFDAAGDAPEYCNRRAAYSAPTEFCQQHSNIKIHWHMPEWVMRTDQDPFVAHRKLVFSRLRLRGGSAP